MPIKKQPFLRKDPTLETLASLFSSVSLSLYLSAFLSRPLSLSVSLSLSLSFSLFSPLSLSFLLSLSSLSPLSLSSLSPLCLSLVFYFRVAIATSASAVMVSLTVKPVVSTPHVFLAGYTEQLKACSSIHTTQMQVVKHVV